MGLDNKVVFKSIFIISWENSIDDRYLLLIKNKNQWQLPNVIVKKDESSIKSVVSGIRTIANLNIDENQLVFLNMFDEPKKNEKIRVVSAAYFLFIDEVKKIKMVTNKKISKNKEWFKIDELPKELLQDHEIIIEEFKQQQCI